MPSASRTQRLFHLISLLQSSPGITASHLQHRLGTSERTLFRDLDELRGLGVLVTKDGDGGYRIGRPSDLPALDLSSEQYLSLRLIMKWAETALHSPLFREGMHAIDRLLSQVRRPEGADGIDHAVRESVSVADRASAGPSDAERWFPLIFEAIRERRVCRLRFQPSGGQPEQTVLLRPYLLHHWREAWYLIGYCEDHREERMNKLIRIRALDLTERRFERPAGYVVGRYLHDAWSLVPAGERVPVRLRFSSHVALDVSEVRWHPSQQLHWRPDGRLDVHFAVSGTSEIFWWILGYGDEVEVLEPPQLRHRVLETARRMVQRYATIEEGQTWSVGVQIRRDVRPRLEPGPVYREGGRPGSPVRHPDAGAHPSGSIGQPRGAHATPPPAASPPSITPPEDRRSDDDA